MHTPAVPIYTDGSKSGEDGVGCTAVFPDFDMFISIHVFASIFTVNYVLFSSPFLAFCFTPVTISSFILTPEVPYRPLGAFLRAIP